MSVQSRIQGRRDKDIFRHMEHNTVISHVLRFRELAIKMQEKKHSKDKEALC